MKTVNKKTSKKTSAKKSVKKESERKDFDDVESLVVLNHPKERKKLDGIDERIKFLKTELKSLLGDTKTDRNSESLVNKHNSFSLIHNDAERTKDLKRIMKPAENLTESQIREGRGFKPNFNSTPKFSEWLDKTIDDMDTTSQEPYANKVLHNSEPQINSAFRTPTPDLLSTSSSSKPLLSQEYVEQLLYKSFLMQNSDLNISSSEASGAELNRSTSKRRQQKCKKSGKPQKKIKKARPRQSNVRACRRSGMPYLSPDNGIEVINLDSSSSTYKIPDKSIVCVDLEVSDYDWSEPFDINEETGIHSDIQVLEGSEVKDNYRNSRELKSNSSEVAESQVSGCHDESGKIGSKKLWECPVCFERSKGQEIVATQCGHIFCRKCLENHMSKLNSNCPSCRCDFRDKPFITLFNF